MEKIKVQDLPEGIEVLYSIKASIVKAELDGIEIGVKDGKVVVLPWGEDYQPNADFRPIYICAHTFYEPSDKWVKTETSWVYVTDDITYETVEGGRLGKWWEIRYIILPPFPEIPSYKETGWNGWKIHGELWDKEGVSFSRGKWRVNLPLLFNALETRRELDFLSKTKVWFTDENGSAEYGSESYQEFFFKRISYLAEKLGVEDPAIRLKEQEDKKAEADAEARRAEEELVEVPYLFFELNYHNKKIEFEIRGGKAYRLYGDNRVMLDILPFSMTTMVRMTRAQSRHPINAHRVDLGKNYAAIYKPAAKEEALFENKILPAEIPACR